MNNSKNFFLFFIILSLFVLSTPVHAFEDNFDKQLETGHEFSNNWATSIGNGWRIDVTSSPLTTYNKVLRIENYFSQAQQTAASTNTAVSSSSNYWAMQVVQFSYSATGVDNVKVNFYNSAGSNIGSYPIHSYLQTYSSGTAKSVLYEFISDSVNMFLKVNGTTINLGTISGTPSFFGLSAETGNRRLLLYVEMITNNNAQIGIGTDSQQYKVTELNNPQMNISWLTNTIPQTDFLNSENKIKICKVDSATCLRETIVKNIGTLNSSGYDNFNWQTLLGITNYGLYFSYLQKNNITVASDFFFFQPPGATNSVTTADVSAVIGQSEAISYSIGTPDFVGSSYAINVYSLSALVDSLPIATGSATGTVYWDTTDNSAGIYFVTLSKTTSGLQTDLAYTTITLVSTLFIRGNVYDAVNGTGLTGVAINYKQGTTWFNTTSNGNGSYNLSGLTVALLTSINASKSGWIHDNFSFTPFAPQIYTINLYMIPTSFNCSVAAGGVNVSNTCINGMILNNPYRQAVPGATVNIGNVNYSNTTTSSAITGYYQFLNLTDDSMSVYVVNATKTGFQNSPDYNVTTLNQTDKQQIILMSEIYTLTIQAQDATNANTLLDFLLLFNLANYNTTVGQITIPNLIYGQYPAIVSATDYISSSQTVLVDSSKIVTFHLSPIVIPPVSTVFKTLPHDVSWTVQDLAFDKKAGVYVTAQGYNTTVGSWSWLSNLIGIDFGAIPINNATMNGTTGTDGSIDFKMDGSIFYILTFSGGGIGNITWQGYPTGYQYLIIAPTTLYGTFNNNVDEIATITTVISTSVINANSANIYANYSDSLNQTTNTTFYLNQTINGDPNNQTNIQTIYGGTNGTYSAQFTISPYSGKDYIVTVRFVETSVGTVTRSYGVSFPPTSPLAAFNPISVLMLIIGLVIFFAGFWGQTSTEQGSAVIVGLCWLLSGIGLYTGLNLGINFYLGLTLATVIAILMNMNSRARKEGMN